MSDPKFTLGETVMTPGVIEAFYRNKQFPDEFLYRHTQGDWGDLDEEDKSLNDEAITDGSRILSAYTLADGTKFWIITYPGAETCLLLPEEY